MQRRGQFKACSISLDVQRRKCEQESVHRACVGDPHGHYLLVHVHGLVTIPHANKSAQSRRQIRTIAFSVSCPCAIFLLLSSHGNNRSIVFFGDSKADDNCRSKKNRKFWILTEGEFFFNSMHVMCVHKATVSTQYKCVMFREWSITSCYFVVKVSSAKQCSYVACYCSS